MRALLAALAMLFSGVRAVAQTLAPVAAPARQAIDTPDIAREVDRQRAAGETYLPDADYFSVGNRTVAAHTRVDGPIAVAHGDLDVFGTISGDAYALGGNIRVHRGAHITGDALAAGGTVLIDGGTVEGQKRAITGAAAGAATAFTRATHPPTTLESVKLVIGWFALLAIMGLGVMIFAEQNLDGVALSLEQGFAQAFWTGLLGQVLLLPALMALIVGLAITVLGVLLIPFAIVAYVIALAGLVTLGFLAVSRIVGGAMTPYDGVTSLRGVHLRALTIGLGIYLGVWLLAALFTWNPFAGAVLRSLAIALTWVAATLGLGAALRSRAGTRRPGHGTASGATDELAWQTPTPVSGVAAASRRAVTTK